MKWEANRAATELLLHAITVEGLPVRIAEYVVVHELAHLHEPQDMVGRTWHERRRAHRRPQ